MKSIYDFDVLQNEVFYRSEHILKYLERHKYLSDLDKVAIANTILDALVTKGLMDPNAQSLDFEHLEVCDDLDHIVYNPTPDVTSIPLSYKELMRQRCLNISGGIPVAVFCSKPAGPIHTCIYDMNTAFSSFFPWFKFLLCDYDSPTRPGQKAVDRPFLEVIINGEHYLVDMLGKLIFKTGWFKENFNLEVTWEMASDNFDAERQEFYKKQTADEQNIALYLGTLEIFAKAGFNNPRLEEMVYETEQISKNFPNALKDFEAMKEDMAKCGIFINKNIV